ncbi:excalibur calcium-binding domain-containing protein [Pseudarthrobacter sp. MDT3-1]
MSPAATPDPPQTENSAEPTTLRDEGPVKPAPVVQAPAPAPAAAYFGSCAEAKAAGAAPLFAGQAGYRAALDRDKDGVACES